MSVADGAQQVTGTQAEPGRSFGLDFYLNLGHEGLLLHFQVHHALHAFELAAYFLGLGVELVEVGAENAHHNGSRGAGEHSP